jgi:DNA-binding transcriptional LysR family regulator
MALTPEGSRLLAPAEAALGELAALDRAAGVPVAGGHELRVGAGDALGRDKLPRAMKALLREAPKLSIRLVEGATPRLIDALRAGEIDLALVSGPVPAEGRSAAVVVETILESRVDLLAPAGMRLGTPPSAAAVAAARVVTLQRGSAFRRHLEEAFAESGVAFRPAVEVGNLSLVRRFVAAGLGVAPVPAIAFAHGREPRGLHRRPLPWVPPVRYSAVRRAGVPALPHAARLLALLRRSE